MRQLLRYPALLLLALTAAAGIAACGGEPEPTPTPTRPPATPAPSPQPKAASFPDFRYGMQVDPGTDMPRAFRLLKEAGFGWAKIQVRWDGVESARGQANWSVLDEVVQQATAADVQLLFSVVAAPGWARDPQSNLAEPGPPADPADMANFMEQMATRYKGRVQAYEIWNEQNLAREWGGEEPNAADYVRLLQASYAATKQADPAAIVVAGALTPAGDVDLGEGLLARDDRVFLREMYQAGMQGHYDALGVHPSGFNNPPGDDPDANTTASTEFKGHWSFYFRNFENYRAIMEEFGESDKKLWFTEFGWASGDNPAPEYKYAAEISEEQQARYLVEAIDMARRSGYVGAVFLWNLNYAPSADAGDVQGKRVFSVLRSDWSPRPAYQALKEMPK